MPLLEIKDLQVAFTTEVGALKAVDSVSLSIEEGGTLGIVGESGCGKSVTALSVLRLIPNPPGEVVGGQILYKGSDLLALPAREMPSIRGREIAMIFQDPMTSLNPVFTVEKQLGEVLRLRFGLKKLQAREKSIEVLRDVGIAEPETHIFSYPHELSGGMKQRIMIAMALICKPTLLIADEPTTALDVTIQAQILDLIGEMQAKTRTAVILITHDMGVVAETCDRVAVMYAGRIAERGSALEIFEKPWHPYTRGLLDSIPRKGLSKDQELPTIEGMVPSLLSPPKGCRFAERCFRRKEMTETERSRCDQEDPLFSDPNPSGPHEAACHFPLGGPS